MAEIKVSFKQLTSDPGKIEIFIENLTDSPIEFLKWGTPLDDVDNDLFYFTTSNRNMANYVGLRYKRIFDPKVSLACLKAKEKISKIYDINANYSFKALGIFSLELKNKIFMKSASRKVLGTVEVYSENINYFCIDTNSRTSLDRIPEGINSLPSVDKLIELLESPDSSRPDNSTCPKHPFCVNATAHGGGCKYPGYYVSDPLCVNMSQQLESTIKNAYQLFYNGIRGIEIKNNAMFTKWFGDYKFVDNVTQKLIGIWDQQVCKNHRVYFEPAGGPSSDTLAAFQKSPDTTHYSVFYIYPRLLKQPVTGRDSIVGTTIHELSHGYGNTIDHKYGVVDCINLAKISPQDAVNNADSIEYYFEDYLFKL